VSALASAVFLGISSVADQRSTKKVKKRKALSPQIFVDLVRQPLWLATIGANVAGFALQVVALDNGSLALVQPLLVGDLISAVLISWYLRKRAHIKRPGGKRADQAMFAGVAATSIGVAGFLAIGQPSPGTNHATFTTLPPLAIGLALLVGTCLTWGARNPNLRPLTTALACGLCYGVAAFSIKLVTAEFGGGPSQVLSDWPIYLFLVVGPLGFLLNQDAFQQGTFLAPVQAIITSADPVVSIGLGIAWLNVTVRNSPAAIAGQVVALLVMVAGIVVTAQHSPQAAEHPTPASAPQQQTAQLAVRSCALELGGAVRAAGGGARGRLVRLRGGL
jgi:hypothetical protein